MRLLAHPQVTCTQRVLAPLAELGGALVVCDSRSLPVRASVPKGRLPTSHSGQAQGLPVRASGRKTIADNLQR